MYKIALTGQANSGKNTAAKILVKKIKEYDKDCNSHQFIAFADPIKQMAHTAFPEIPRKWLYGASKFRSEIIPGAFKDGDPLTVRRLLIDLGNDFGRKYDSNIWINNFKLSLRKAQNKNINIIIVPDCRRINELNILKSLNFFNIKILRNKQSSINDASETEQNAIPDSEFDFIINNIGSKNDLKKIIEQIIPKLSV